MGHLQQARSATSSPWPPQLEMHVPFEPTTFPSAGDIHLAYELYLTNFASDPVTLSRIEVLDADSAVLEPVAAFEGERLDQLLQPLGAQANGSSRSRQIVGGASVVVFMWVDFKPGAHVPKQLRHRVTTGENRAEGAVIGTHHTQLKALTSPVQGTLATHATSAPTTPMANRWSLWQKQPW
jgi:hypothetical protein